MLLEIVACVSIVVIALLVKLSWWRQRCNRLIPNNQPSFFNPLGEVFDYDAFEFSGQKQAVHLGIMKAFAKWSNKFKKYPLCCTWIAYTPYTLIHKSEAVRDLLQVKKNIEKSWLYYFFQTIVGKGLFTCDSTQWKDRRKLFAPCFQSNMLKGYLTVFNEHSHKFVKYLMKETENDFTIVDEMISLSTLDIVCECIMGVNIGALENESKQYVESLHRSLDLLMARVLKFWQWPNLLYWNSKTGRETAYHKKVVNDFSRVIIEERKRRYLNGEKSDDSTKYKSLLEVLLKLHIEDQALDEKGVRQEVDTFIVAGHDTVATTIKWTLYLIGLHPEVQEKIHQEVDSVLEGDADRPLSVDDLSDLKYLDCVLKECNRLYPSVPQFGRSISEDTKICGYTAPKGASAIVMTYFLHRDEDVFPDPEKFDPDRFLPENKNKIPEFAYVPFGAGARHCIGRWFGEMEVKTMMCHILRNFTLHSLDSRDKMLTIMNITLQSTQPFRIRFRSRHNNNSK
ncbi:cytochrome P450 4V2 [Caerostris darwini]|uniref:Cytochrome P450 4V2 n=1 Tax=Caerostris darwini TaxID=1538125 RepID=A0AAV4N0L6_9ARAC|nr:cytochrome P450 4V2 [Caerostris darwini]